MNSIYLRPPNSSSQNRRKTTITLELLRQDHVVEGVADVHLADVNKHGNTIACINFD